jgi:metallophosphoesterase superfamily enzyme
LGDGVTRAAKCPCFLIGRQLIVLPAFSSWAAGTILGADRFMSSLARQETFITAVAILNEKLLAVPLE